MWCHLWKAISIIGLPPPKGTVKNKRIGWRCFGTFIELWEWCRWLIASCENQNIISENRNSGFIIRNSNIVNNDEIIIETEFYNPLNNSSSDTISNFKTDLFK